MRGLEKLSTMTSDPSQWVKIKLPDLYANYRGVGEYSDVARILFEQSDWFCCAVDFDPKSGQALPQSLSSVLSKIARYVSPETGALVRDRLWRITEHSRASVERLFRALNETPRREQAMLPVHAVRELDATSFIKLSNRPGRTLREKLAGNPYLQAVRRFQSVDLPENRLLKAFVVRLAQLLELRSDCLGHEDNLLPKIQSWLRSDEARNIARWDNLPPNNTLLSHRDYRRVWDAWRWLSTLDDDTAGDLSKLKERDQTLRTWTTYAKMWTDGAHRFADMPIFFDFETFEIRPWVPNVAVQQTPEKIHRNVGVQGISTPVCVDLTLLRPRYAAATTAKSLPDTFLWQQWKNDNDTVAIELFNADAAYHHPQASTLSVPDLFFSKTTSEHLDRAARAFASRLHAVFRSDTLVWLVPDALNDFELDVVRRNLNARFPDAEPLPRSVAAAFERVDYSKVKDGFPIVVIDTVGGKTCVTKLLAKFDPDIKRSLSETGGFYWERHPPIVIASAESEIPEQKHSDIASVDAQGKWCDATRAVRPPVIDASTLKRDSRIGPFAFAINLTESPVTGGIRLHNLQQRAGAIALWRDQVPELSIKVLKDGRHQRFHLVSRGTTVKPIRGRPVIIHVGEDFTLPAGKPFYQFPLFLGESSEDLGYSARLDSTAFPLRENTVCKLHLTFEYGADDPYKLLFIPHDDTFQPVRATWQRTEEVSITDDAPAPEYPAPITWADLRRVPKPDSNETSDLPKWVTNAIGRLDQDFYTRPKARTIGVIKMDWCFDKKGGYFTFADRDTTEGQVFIHQNNFIHGLNHADFTQGDSISFELQEKDGKHYGRKVAAQNHTETERLKDFDEASTRSVVKKIRSGLYYPVIQIWRDGRSIDDPECPKEFSEPTRDDIRYLVALLNESALPEPIKNEIFFLMCSMGKDAPDECVQWINEQVAKENVFNPRALGFTLGSVSEPWQKQLLSKLMDRPTESTLRAFAYAVWRDQHFIEKFDLAQLRSILDLLSAKLSQIRSCPPRKGENDKRVTVNWTRATAELLELLLGLLRARDSSDAEIKMLLQPHQRITKELANKVERVTELVAQSKVGLFSRVQINIEKPDGDHTPDLLFALRLYLTGDDGANAIHITSISDNLEE